MRKRVLIFVSGILLLLIAGVGGWQLLPRVVAAVPAAYQHRLPDPLLDLVTTPLPTALPAPTAVAPPPDIVIPTLSSERSSVVSEQSSVPGTPTPLSTQHSALSTQSSALSTSTPALSTPLPAPTPLPPYVRITDLEILPQKFNNCGPANLTIVLNHYNQPADQLEIGAEIKPNYDDRNVSPWELADYVNKHTPLRARWFVGGDLDLLRRLLAHGYPVIIEKGLLVSEREGWMGHYLTLVGYDDAAEEMISFDTFLGPWDSSGRRDSYEAIAEYWAQFNHAFILVYPPGQTSEVTRLLSETMADPVTMWRETAVSAQHATQQQPDDAFAWFNLGSSLTQLAARTGSDELYTSAAAAFDQARTLGLPWRMLWYQFEPYQAYLAAGRTDDVLTLTDAVLSSAGGQHVEETYLYRGRALARVGETAAAAQAFAQAQALNPNLRIDDS